MENISDRNPHLDDMRDKGYAWVLRSTLTGKYGAPSTDDEWYANRDNRGNSHDELLIIFFDE